jgi:hypothetical protein
MGYRFIFTHILCLLVLGGPCFASTPSPSADRNIRSRDRLAGYYLAPKPDLAQPERENFSTTQLPVTPLSTAEFQTFLENSPELANYRVVIIGPPVQGDQAEVLKTKTEELLSLAGISPDVQVIRHPRSLKEKLLNLLPRREDYEKPTHGELSVAAGKILISESLSFAVLLLPPILKMSGTQMGETVDQIVHQIALPIGVATTLCVLDVVNMIPLVSFRRALSNHNIRLSTVERFLRTFFLSLFFSSTFYLTSQAPQLAAQISQTPLSSLPADLAKGLLAAGAIILPSSIFNMLSRTTTTSAINEWEQSGPNRRFLASVFEAVTNILIAPIYILSTMPLLQTIAHVPLMELNAAHLAMLSVGAGGAAAWISVKKEKVETWIKSGIQSCRNKLTQLGTWFSTGEKRN